MAISCGNRCRFWNLSDVQLMSRMQEEMYENGNNYDVALNNFLLTTGNAILFSGIKFQSRMSALIGLILFIKMFLAITLQPLVIHYFKPKFLLATIKLNQIVGNSPALATK